MKIETPPPTGVCLSTKWWVPSSKEPLGPPVTKEPGSWGGDGPLRLIEHQGTIKMSITVTLGSV